MQNNKKSPLAKMQEGGIKCHYVRFHQSVPPGVNREPVSEFYTKSSTSKYVVDSITYTPDGLIFEANGELDIVPLANVIYARTSKE